MLNDDAIYKILEVEKALKQTIEANLPEPITTHAIKALADIEADKQRILKEIRNAKIDIMQHYVNLTMIEDKLQPKPETKF